MKICKTFFFLAVFATYGCRNDRTSVNEKIVDFNSSVSYAKRFTLDKNAAYTKLTIINPWQGAKNLNQSYFLLKRGNVVPSGIDSSSIIFVPLKSIICMSTSYAAMISALGEENSITGMSGATYLFDTNLIQRAKQDLIDDVGYDSGLNKELILKISPDIIMMYGIGSESESYLGKIKELGINVIFNADYLETDPLGKAEWLKVFGALYCKEQLADSIFDSEVNQYNSIRNKIIHNAKTHPKVLLGLPFKDTWYISPGNSYISKLISDAGGEYLWENTVSSTSMPLGLENVYIRALSADYWLNTGTAKNRADISNVDQRLKDLPPFQNGRLYNNIKRTNTNGGNDYWEKGSIYPHLILNDIASILHPEIFDDQDLFFYIKLK